MSDIRNSFVLISGIVLLTLIACEIFNNKKPNEKPYVEIDPESFDQTLFDSVRFYAVPKGTSDTILIQTWRPGESFPTKLFYPAALGEDFILIIKGIKNGSTTFENAAIIDQTLPPDSVVVAIHPDSLPINGPNDPVVLDFIISFGGHIFPLTGTPSVSENGQIKIERGDTLKYSVIPDTGYYFSGGGGSSINDFFNPRTDIITVFANTSDSIAVNFSPKKMVLQLSISDSNCGTYALSGNPDSATFFDSLFVSSLPGEGCAFDKWEDGMGNVITQGSFLITHKDTAKFILFFKTAKIPLNITLNNSSQGTISFEPIGTFAAFGDIIILTATPHFGFSFSAWSGDTSTSQTIIQFVVNDTVDLTANFELRKYPIFVKVKDSLKGAITLEPDNKFIEHGNTLKITATPTISYSFVSWTGDTTTSQSSIQLVVTDTVNLTANFSLRFYEIFASVNDSLGGTITLEPDTNLFQYGNTLRITASPNSEYEFTSWQGSSNSTNPIIQIVIIETVTITAFFTKKGHVPDVIFSDSGQRFNDKIIILLSTPGSPAGTKIYYTTDNSTPTTSSSLYLSSVTINATTVLKARAFNSPDYNPSQPSSATYIKNIAPIIAVSSPTLFRDSVIVTDKSFSIQGTAFDETAINSIGGTLNDSGVSIIGKTSWSGQMSLSGNIWNEIAISVTDDEGLSTSISVYVFFKSPLAVPFKPANTNVELSQLSFEWLPVQDATHYIILRSTDSLVWTSIDTTTNTNYLNINLIPATDYWYAIKAYFVLPGGFGEFVESPVSDPLKQTTYIVFEKRITLGLKAEGHKIYQLKDESYVIGGFHGSNSRDCAILKFDRLGKGTGLFVFEHSGEDYCTDMIITPDSGYLLAGYSDGQSTPEDLFLIKSDKNGNEEWIKYYGGTDVDQARSVINTKDGKYAVFGNKGADLWFLKLETNGDTLFTKTFSGTGLLRGSGLVQELNSGKYFFSAKAGSQILVMALDNVGNVTDSSNFPVGNLTNEIIQAFGNTLIVAGRTTGAGNEDGMLLKVDFFLNNIWDIPYGGSSDEMTNSVFETSDKGFIHVGISDSYTPDKAVFLVKSSSDGILQWKKEYDFTGIDEGYSVIQTSDGGYAFIGTSDKDGGSSYYFVKTDSQGNIK